MNTATAAPWDQRKIIDVTGRPGWSVVVEITTEHNESSAPGTGRNHSICAPLGRAVAARVIVDLVAELGSRDAKANVVCLLGRQREAGGEIAALDLALAVHAPAVARVRKRASRRRHPFDLGRTDDQQAGTALARFVGNAVVQIVATARGRIGPRAGEFPQIGGRGA